VSTEQPNAIYPLVCSYYYEPPDCTIKPEVIACHKILFCSKQISISEYSVSSLLLPYAESEEEGEPAALCHAAITHNIHFSPQNYKFIYNYANILLIFIRLSCFSAFIVANLHVTNHVQRGGNYRLSILHLTRMISSSIFTSSYMFSTNRSVMPKMKLVTSNSLSYRQTGMLCPSLHAAFL